MGRHCWKQSSWDWEAGPQGSLLLGCPRFTRNSRNGGLTHAVCHSDLRLGPLSQGDVGDKLQTSRMHTVEWQPLQLWGLRQVPAGAAVGVCLHTRRARSLSQAPRGHAQQDRGQAGHRAGHGSGREGREEADVGSARGVAESPGVRWALIDIHNASCWVDQGPRSHWMFPALYSVGFTLTPVAPIPPDNVLCSTRS